jgi:hypothetical protein
VQHHHRLAVGPAALLDIDPLPAGNLEDLLAERFDRRIKPVPWTGTLA